MKRRASGDVGGVNFTAVSSLVAFVVLVVWYFNAIADVGRPTMAVTIAPPTGTPIATVVALDNPGGLLMFEGSGPMSQAGSEFLSARSDALLSALRPASFLDAIAATPVPALSEPEPVQESLPLPTQTPILWTPTPSPTPSPTPHPVNTRGVVVRARELNTRYGPGVQWPVQSRLRRDDVVLLVGRNMGGTWGQLDSGLWVSLSYVSIPIDFDLSWLPIVAAPPQRNY